MSDNNVEIKKLRNEVQLLRDEFAIMKRKYEDIIYNLDTDNFSSRFVKEQGDMRTKIEVTAKGIESKVSNEEFESTKTQLTDKITSEVKRLDDTMTSTVEQEVGKISLSISDTLDDLHSRLTVSEQGIESVVSKNISAKFTSSEMPTRNGTSDKQKSMLCEYGNTLYYYNDITKSWKKYPYADGVKSQFLQTESGFQLTGDVKITEIAQVGGDLYIGDENTTDEQKKIVFSKSVNIKTINQGYGAYYGLEISSDGLNLVMKPDRIKFTKPDAGSFSSGSISLADYVAQYGSGGGGTATFA